MLMHLLVIAFALIMTIPAFAQAQAPAKMLRTGATIEKFDGHKLTVKTDAGEELSLTLPADVRVTRSRPATLADVKAGQFIGCTAVEGPDGKLRAKEIHILPESMRGVGEGHYPWNDAPKTTMTNGNIEHVAGITDGNVIKVSYKGGRSEIEIRPDVTVTVIEVAGRDALKPGTKINLFAQEPRRQLDPALHQNRFLASAGSFRWSLPREFFATRGSAGAPAETPSRQ